MKRKRVISYLGFILKVIFICTSGFSIHNKLKLKSFYMCPTSYIYRSRFLHSLSSRLFLDHSRRHKPEGSKNSQSCDLTWAAHPTLLTFSSSMKKYPRNTSGKMSAGELDTLPSRRPAPGIKPMWGLNCLTLYALLRLVSLATES